MKDSKAKQARSRKPPPRTRLSSALKRDGNRRGGGGSMLSSKSYADIYADIRSAIDFCHRDGSLKRHVAANPGHYIHKDQNLVPLLQDLRFSGKKTFIVTNRSAKKKQRLCFGVTTIFSTSLSLFLFPVSKKKH